MKRDNGNFRNNLIILIQIRWSPNERGGKFFKIGKSWKSTSTRLASVVVISARRKFNADEQSKTSKSKGLKFKLFLNAIIFIKNT